MTTAPNGSPYGIEVEIEAWQPGMVETPEEWDANQHTAIELRSSLDPNTDHGYSHEEMLTGYRWAAGVLARAALKFHENVESHYRQIDRLIAMGREPATSRHRCASDPDGTVCGFSFEEGVTDFWTEILKGCGAPFVIIYVPTQDAKRWLAHFRRRIGKMLATDNTPTGPAPQPDHRQVHLTDPTPTRKAST